MRAEQKLESWGLVEDGIEDGTEDGLEAETRPWDVIAPSGDATLSPDHGP